MLVSPDKTYESNSPFDRFLLNSATAVAIRLLRIRVRVSGMEKLPKDEKVLFVGNHRSNFDPLITWNALKKLKIALVSKPENFKVPFLGGSSASAAFCPLTGKIPEGPRYPSVFTRRGQEAEHVCECHFTTGCL